MTTDLDRVDDVAGQVPLPGMPEPVATEAAAPAEKVPYGRRLTLRQRADVARGVHPLTRTKARPDLGTCGDCAHRVLIYTNGNRRWPKCDLREITHGPGSDCRAWWPACDRFEPGDRISDDAARWTPEHADRSEARP